MPQARAARLVEEMHSWDADWTREMTNLPPRSVEGLAGVKD
jgi:hypothetical protein